MKRKEPGYYGTIESKKGLDQLVTYTILISFQRGVQTIDNRFRGIRFRFCTFP